jgi:hypothetical protein
MEQQDWTVKKEISIADMTEAVANLRSTKESYDSAKAQAEAAYAIYKDAEQKVIGLLEESGQETFIASGLGRVTVSHQLSVTTPKTPEEKQAFFDWLKKEMGEDGFWAYATVNSQSLNSLYKQKVSEYASKGEVLEIDGLQPATSFTKLSFTKK